MPSILGILSVVKVRNNPLFPHQDRQRTRQENQTGADACEAMAPRGCGKTYCRRGDEVPIYNRSVQLRRTGKKDHPGDKPNDDDRRLHFKAHSEAKGVDADGAVRHRRHDGNEP